MGCPGSGQSPPAQHRRRHLFPRTGQGCRGARYSHYLGSAEVPARRLAVMPDLPHPGGVRDAIPPPLVKLEVAGFVFHIERSLGYGLLVDHAHRVFVTGTISAHQLRINNRGLVKLLVAAIITNRRQNVPKFCIRDERCAHPIVDQAGGYGLRVLPTDGRDQNLTPANTLQGSGSPSTQRKGPWRESICKFAAWRYVSQVFRVSSFNSAPRDATGATRESAQTSITTNRHSIRDMQPMLKRFSLADDVFIVGLSVLEMPALHFCLVHV